MTSSGGDCIVLSDSEDDDLIIVDEKIQNYGTSSKTTGLVECSKEMEDSIRETLMKQNPQLLPKGNFKLKIYSFNTQFPFRRYLNKDSFLK